jgi:hypothetical protein
MKLTLLEELNFLPAFGRSDVTPAMATRSAAVDMAVKWRLIPRNRFACSSFIPQNLWPLFNGVFGGSSIKNPPCAKLSRIELPFYCNVNGYDPSLPLDTKILSSPSSVVSFISVRRPVFVK